MYPSCVVLQVDQLTTHAQLLVELSYWRECKIIVAYRWFAGEWVNFMYKKWNHVSKYIHSFFTKYKIIAENFWKFYSEGKHQNDLKISFENLESRIQVLDDLKISFENLAISSRVKKILMLYKFRAATTHFLNPKTRIRLSSGITLSEFREARWCSNVDSYLNSAAWPTGCKGFFCSETPE